MTDLTEDEKKRLHGYFESFLQDYMPVFTSYHAGSVDWLWKARDMCEKYVDIARREAVLFEKLTMPIGLLLRNLGEIFTEMMERKEQEELESLGMKPMVDEDTIATRVKKRRRGE